MKWYYVANSRIPTEKAHGVQIMKTCEALAQAGVDLELVLPKRDNPLKDDTYAYYGVATTFPITYLPVWDTVSWGRVGFAFESLFFAWKASKYIKKNVESVVFSRDEWVLFGMRILRRGNFFWESHTGAWSFVARYVTRHARGVIAITQGLKDFYITKGISKNRIVVAPDGIDLDAFKNPESKEAARTRLGIPLDIHIAGYIGRLDGWKGTDTLMEAASLLPQHIRLMIIGGESQEVEQYKKQYPDILFLGYRPYRELAHNQAAVDVLVLPNTAKQKISTHFTSPLKLFTYMASGRPIIASNLSSIKEVLNESNALLIEPDSPHAIAEAIVWLAEHQEEGGALAAQARKDVDAYSWQNRAKKIEEFVEATMV